MRRAADTVGGHDQWSQMLVTSLGSGYKGRWSEKIPIFKGKNLRRENTELWNPTDYLLAHKKKDARLQKMVNLQIESLAGS